MDAKEIEQLETLREELNGVVNKVTAIRSRDIYNKYHEKGEHITDCMCSRIRRKILGKSILEWYERQDR